MAHTLLGIIGHNISYTLSPVMHNEAITALDLPYAYGVFDVSADMLPGLIAAIRREKIRGANVTKPHKQAVLPLMNELSAEASALGAVNTIVNTDGVLRGENTDVDGVRASLKPHRDAIRDRSVLVLGAGGAARAVIYAAAECAPRKITIWNRNAARAAEAARAFETIFPAVAIGAAGSDALEAAAREAALIVNTTTVGQVPDTAAMPIPASVRFSNHQIIFDIIYNPLRTALLRKAEADGARTIDGMEMFIQQAAHSFTLWTGRDFPADKARERVLHELENR